MGKQGRMLRFIREMISERWIKVRVLSVTLVAINGILGELGNEVDRSLFVDDLAIYITNRN